MQMLIDRIAVNAEQIVALSTMLFEQLQGDGLEKETLVTVIREKAAAIGELADKLDDEPQAKIPAITGELGNGG